MQDPSIGRIVRFVLPETSRRAGDVRPAIVTKVSGRLPDPENPHACNLHIVLDGPNDAGTNAWYEGVPYDEKREPGTWHWPERD